MRAPEVHRNGNFFSFIWHDAQVAAEVRRVRESGEYVKAEVTWRSIAPGEPPHLHSGLLNLMSTSAKKQLGNALAERHPDKDWVKIIEQLAYTTVRAFRKGEPPVALRTSGEGLDPIALAVAPFFFEGLPFVLFGKPGTAKSYLALLIVALAATGSTIRGVPFSAEQPIVPLYLDWESNVQGLTNRVVRIEKGLGINFDETIHYRYCSGSLANMAEQLQEMVLAVGANLLVIDSLGPAAGGDLNSPQSAQDFFAALRTLKCTSIILAHCAKNGDTRHRSIFGSQFFNALARGTAEVRRFQEAGEDEISVGVYHRKSNLSRLERPFGLRLHFEGSHGPVTLTTQNLRGVPDLSEGLSAAARILDVLASSNRPSQPKQIAEITGISAGTVRKTLQRLRDRNSVVQLPDGSYGARVREEEDVPF